jgi:hypothetical protein
VPGWPPRWGTPSTPPGDTDSQECYEIEGMPSRCVHIHSPLPNTQFFNHNEYAKDSKCDKDDIADLLSTLSVVLATVPGRHRGSGSGSKQNHWQIGSPGRQ